MYRDGEIRDYRFHLIRVDWTRLPSDPPLPSDIIAYLPEKKND
jgi:hypothetical protein